MRKEGDNWNAYFAASGHMSTPIFLGSIRIGAVLNNPERKAAFAAMMGDIVSDIIEAKTGERPTWGDPTECPEHEKSRSA